MNLTRLIMRRRSIRQLLGRTFGLIALCILICELLIPFFYIVHCDWPANKDEYRLRSIAFSDTHLLGSRRGYFLDKFKREWSMHIAFQLALLIFRPNSALFLGDIFDEGLIANKQEFANYSARFFQLFFIPNEVDLTVSVGNHDAGFHDRMFYFPVLRHRFEMVFNSSLIELKQVNTINVINVNSMAMEGDHCELCSLAEFEVRKVSSKLFRRCGLGESVRLCEEQRPILMTHFPLYRESDVDCNEADSNYHNQTEKSNIVPGRSCMSKDATNFLLKYLQPRIALNGHTHYGCNRRHAVKLNNTDQLIVDEHTLSSFNYRNRPNPGFILLLANSNKFRISRCILPNETHLFIIYLTVIMHITINLFRQRGLIPFS